MLMSVIIQKQNNKSNTIKSKSRKTGDVLRRIKQVARSVKEGFKAAAHRMMCGRKLGKELELEERVCMHDAIGEELQEEDANDDDTYGGVCSSMHLGMGINANWSAALVSIFQPTGDMADMDSNSEMQDSIGNDLDELKGVDEPSTEWDNSPSAVSDYTLSPFHIGGTITLDIKDRCTDEEPDISTQQYMPEKEDSIDGAPNDADDAEKEYWLHRASMRNYDLVVYQLNVRQSMTFQRIRQSKQLIVRKTQGIDSSDYGDEWTAWFEHANSGLALNSTNDTLPTMHDPEHTPWITEESTESPVAFECPYFRLRPLKHIYHSLKVTQSLVDSETIESYQFAVNGIKDYFKAKQDQSNDIAEGV